MFSRDEISQAVPGDCSGEKYQGEIFDENLTEEKVRMSTLHETQVFQILLFYSKINMLDAVDVINWEKNIK